jgi:hypothetical protein
MKKPSTKKQRDASDKKKTRQDKMEGDIERVGIGYFVDGVKRHGNASFTHASYVNLHLNLKAGNYIKANYGSMGNGVLKINAQLGTGIFKGFKPLSGRTIGRIFKSHETVLRSMDLPLHLVA